MLSRPRPCRRCSASLGQTSSRSRTTVENRVALDPPAAPRKNRQWPRENLSGTSSQVQRPDVLVRWLAACPPPLHSTEQRSAAQRSTNRHGQHHRHCRHCEVRTVMTPARLESRCICFSFSWSGLHVTSQVPFLGAIRGCNNAWLFYAQYIHTYSRVDAEQKGTKARVKLHYVRLFQTPSTTTLPENHSVVQHVRNANVTVVQWTVVHTNN